MQAAQVVAQQVIEILQETDNPMPKSWLVQEIMSMHEDSFSDDFGKSAGFDAIERYVRVAINRMKLTPESHSKRDAQLVLPGFQHVQRAYLVPRDREPTLVPVHKLTWAEAQAKIGELRRMGDGCHRHAEELEALFESRGEHVAL